MKFDSILRHLKNSQTSFNNSFRYEKAIEISIISENGVDIDKSNIDKVVENESYSLIKKLDSNKKIKSTAGLSDIALLINGKYLFGDVTVSKEPDWESDQISRHFLESAYLTLTEHNKKIPFNSNFNKLKKDKKIEVLAKLMNNQNLKNEDIYKVIPEYFKTKNIEFSYNFYFEQFQSSKNLAGSELFTLYEIAKNRLGNSFISVDNFHQFDRNEIKPLDHNKIKAIVDIIFSSKLNQSEDINIRNESDQLHFLKLTKELIHMTPAQKQNFLSNILGEKEASKLLSEISDPARANGCVFNLRTYIDQIQERCSNSSAHQIDTLVNDVRDIINKIYITPNNQYVESLAFISNTTYMKNSVDMFNLKIAGEIGKTLLINEIDYQPLNAVNEKMSTLTMDQFKGLNNRNIFSEIDSPFGKGLLTNKFINNNEVILLSKLYNIFERYEKNELEKIIGIDSLSDNNKFYTHDYLKIEQKEYNVIIKEIAKKDKLLGNNISKEMVEVFLNSKNKEEFIAEIGTHPELQKQINSIYKDIKKHNKRTFD